MQVHFRVNDMVTVVGEGDSHTDVFEELASLADAFRDVDVCGCCKSVWTDKDGQVVRTFGIQPIHRQNKQNDDFYEFLCKNFKCKARLSLSQNKKGKTLFPRRKFHSTHPDVVAGKAKDGDWLPNNGWSVYVKPTA